MKRLFLLGVALLSVVGKLAAQSFTVTPSASTYSTSGGQMSFVVSITPPANATSLAFTAKTPSTSWVFESTSGTRLPAVSPKQGDTIDTTISAVGAFGWAYVMIPTSTASFTFVLSYPAGLAGTQTITLAGSYRVGGTDTAVTIPSISLTQAVVASAPTITSQPGNVHVAVGGTVSIGVGVSASPAATVQWQRSTDGGANFSNLSNDANFSGTTTSTLTITSATLAMMGHQFRATATNPSGNVTSNAATLSASAAPAFMLHPRTQAVATGGTLVLSAAASGNPAPTFQWGKGGAIVTNDSRISGATTATLTIANFTAADAGSYTVTATNGITPDAISSNATITSAPTGYGATHALNGAGYNAGGTVTISNTISYSGEISSLGYSVTLPTGWTYASSAGTVQTTPQGTVGTLTWAWTNISGLTSPVAFTYTLNVPTGASGTYFFPASAIIANASADQFTVAANPDPLLVGPVLYHSADTTGDFKINLSELLRVISYYNTRFTNPDNTKIQTGTYKLQSGTPDGFAPDAAKSAAPAAGQGGLATYHAADTDRNGAINLSELLRVISYYNTRFTNPDNTKVQTGAYKVQGGTPDGYAPDPARVP